MRYHASHTAEPGKQREREEKRKEVGDKGNNAYRENTDREYKEDPYSKKEVKRRIRSLNCSNKKSIGLSCKSNQISSSVCTKY